MKRYKFGILWVSTKSTPWNKFLWSVNLHNTDDRIEFN